MDTLVSWLQTILSGGVFLTIGIISFVVLLAAFVLDGIFETFDIGDGTLSLTTLGAFGALFGFVGYAATGFGASVGMAALMGVIAGVLGGIGAWGLSYFFKKAGSSASVSNESLVGKEAIVVIPIQGGNIPGEVRFTTSGITQSYTAYSDTSVPGGKTVTITNIRGGNSLTVTQELNPAQGDTEKQSQTSDNPEQ